MPNPSKKYRKKIADKQWFQRLEEKSKTILIPGFDHVPLYNVIEFFLKGITKGSLNTRASAIAFKALLAIIPSILIFFTIIPYIPIDGIHDTLMEMIREFMPPIAYKATEETITDIINHKRGGLLSIGALLALYFATNGITTIIDAFNNTIHINEKRSFIKRRITAVLLVFISSLILIIAIALLTFGTELLHFLVQKEIIKQGLELTAIETGKWIISIGMIFFLISFLYYMAPSKKFKFRIISAGSTLATFFSVIATLLFKIFINNFGQYNALYGSIGTLIVIMLFIYFNALILLVGFELNASIRYASLNQYRVKKQ
ncbi:MAG: YihY/virulence factor BrkB family protein [Bacteroidales bacterium]